MWFHTHKWVIVNVDYVPPLAFNTKGMIPALLEKLVCGQSIVYLRCSVCGDINQRQFLGKFEKPGDEPQQTPVGAAK